MKKIKIFFWLLKNFHNMNECIIETDASASAYIKTYYASDKLKIKYVMYKETWIKDGKEINSQATKIR